MNTDNYQPSKTVQMNGFRMVYITEVCDNTPKAQEQLIHRLLEIMPRSFAFVFDKKRFNWDEKEVLVLGESSAYILFIVDDSDKTALVVAVRPGAPSFARTKLNRVADRLFETLTQSHKLTLRISAKITHMYIPYLNRAA
jgi:hypothetical protein